jgi:hypothetical protein
MAQTVPPGHQPAPKMFASTFAKPTVRNFLAAGLRDANIFASDLCTAPPSCSSAIAKPLLRRLLSP